MEIKLIPSVSVYEISKNNKRIPDNHRIKKFRGKITNVENSATMKTLIIVETEHQIRNPFDVLNTNVTVMLD